MSRNPSKVPVFILAGGFGTRISEETDLRPKPMIEIGEIPILLHILRYYYRFGFNDFVICAGYRAWEIKRYFLNYEFRLNHLEIDHRSDRSLEARTFGKNLAQENWRVRVVDTGLDTMTGGRVARALDEISQTDHFDDFALTYGDGLTDAKLDLEFDYHVKHGRVGTVLGVKNTARFGELDLGEGDSEETRVEGFLEKPESRQAYINGGFFFFKKSFRNYLNPQPQLILERDPLAKLAKDGELMVYRHDGFWQPMDTLRDKNLLQKLWISGEAPWVL